MYTHDSQADGIASVLHATAYVHACMHNTHTHTHTHDSHAEGIAAVLHATVCAYIHAYITHTHIHTHMCVTGTKYNTC